MYTDELVKTDKKIQGDVATALASVVGGAFEIADKYWRFTEITDYVLVDYDPSKMELMIDGTYYANFDGGNLIPFMASLYEDYIDVYGYGDSEGDDDNINENSDYSGIDVEFVLFTADYTLDSV